MTEELCKKCGRCCRNKTKRNGRVVAEEHCVHYNKQEKRCSIYEQRLNMKTGNGDAVCLTAKQAYDERLLPSNCPYTKHYMKVEGKRIYVCKVVNYS